MTGEGIAALVLLLLASMFAIVTVAGWFDYRQERFAKPRRTALLGTTMAALLTVWCVGGAVWIAR